MPAAVAPESSNGAVLPMLRMLLGFSAALLGLGAAAATVTGTLLIDSAQSSLIAQFTPMQVPVEAPFRKFTGSVYYDPAKPRVVKAHLEIDMTSLDLGSEEYNSEVRSKEWFDSTRYPTAIFEASSVKPVDGNHLRLIGLLNLKGITQSLTMLVTRSSSGGLDTFEGSVPISRTAFHLGGSPQHSPIADQVLMKFHIVETAVR